MHLHHNLLRRLSILVIGLESVVGSHLAAQEYGRLVPMKTNQDFNAVLVASGTIASVDRRNSRLFLKPNKPFWGPLRRGSDTVVLWPTQVQLSAWLGASTPMTIDGKKAHFDDLAAGQKVTVQYIMRFVNDGWLSSLICFARRIDIVSAQTKNKK